MYLISTYLRIALLSLLVLSGIGRAAFALEGEPMMLAVDPAPLVATTSGGEKRFTIEIADEPDERQQGLMFRESLPQDRGMLFVFETTRPVGFWMKNTPLPLDLVFIREDGTIAAIERGEPFSEATISTPQPIRFVLELEQGTAERSGLTVGDRLEHPQIAGVQKAN